MVCTGINNFMVSWETVERKLPKFARVGSRKICVPQAPGTYVFAFPRVASDFANMGASPENKRGGAPS